MRAQWDQCQRTVGPGLALHTLPWGRGGLKGEWTLTGVLRAEGTWVEPEGEEGRECVQDVGDGGGAGSDREMFPGAGHKV